jgi:hypothetical protein
MFADMHHFKLPAKVVISSGHGGGGPGRRRSDPTWRECPASAGPDQPDGQPPPEPEQRPAALKMGHSINERLKNGKCAA